MRISMDVEGLDAIERALTASAESLMPSAENGLENGLRLVQRDAKQLVPQITGELRRSIRTRVTRDGDALAGEVFTAKEYAVYVEMGTGERGRASGGNGSGVQVSYTTKPWAVLHRGKWKDGYSIHYGMAARPYLYPAFKANKSKVVACIQRAVRKGLRASNG